MATICAPVQSLPERTATPPSLSKLNTSQAPLPTRHIPFCSPGPRPSSQQLNTPPASPPSSSNLNETTSLLHPPTGYDQVFNDPPVYALTAQGLADALNHLALQPLPPPQQVFPWTHGLHAENQLQLQFFIARKKALRRTPKVIRALTIVKAGGDLAHSKIKGAIAPDEILSSSIEDSNSDTAEFLEADPKDGFSVRNFQIQTCKMATVSDIVVYGDNQTPREEIKRIAKQISSAQVAWQKKSDGGSSLGGKQFNTFILTDDYTIVETDHPDLIALDSEGCMTGKVMDFFHWERVEMSTMSAQSEISHNVWLGPTPDPDLLSETSGIPLPNHQDFDIMVETSDLAQMPDDKVFQILDGLLVQKESNQLAENAIPQLEFPGSGAILPPTWSHSEVDSLVATCEWIFKQAHNPSLDQRRDSRWTIDDLADADGDIIMASGHGQSSDGRKILIHCPDGYTESSLLALAYYMYAECKPVHEAWLQMHMDKRRNFFAYGSDVALLRAIQPRLLQASPKHQGDLKQLCPPSPDWLERMDGSLPSRILDYMYLGNLGHANNPELLREMGIGQILSVGEPVSWSKEYRDSWPKENLLFVDKVQDNGVDSLTNEFPRCLEFIKRGRRNGTATLVHCRVGVSRSATICIAEVMNEMGLPFPRAYCFVRARRLNVIIQPHLRFTYELLKWEEQQCARRGQPVRRELEWATVAREIAAMNKPYMRQG
ncbi:Dual specificity protein phosphatase PPS1 [Acrodontium crateriforme]|uniref:Dual specificity protein phosphatase PPS1 n=1 Tax=Acrodontium crateriforme TaxID=150365 RepID=A0AAQ3RE29_9PEZI|nr:Dual specificity protein phosphatase PPS1 [Acrodontium crateriforme]